MREMESAEILYNFREVKMRLKSSWISAFLLFFILLKIRAYYEWRVIKEEINADIRTKDEKEFMRKMIGEKKKKYAIKDKEDEHDVENFRKRRNLRLPDLIISGEKKCGTKALQFFLLHHPDIIGKNSELQLRGNKNFTAELAGYLGKFKWDQSGEDLSKRQIRVTKSQLGVAGIRIKDFLRKIKEEYEKPKTEQVPFLHDIKPSLKTWPSEVYIISVICDPVKRLLSDFVHVTDGHGSAEWLDKESSLFPFANLTFDEMVSKHLPKAREIFETGKPEKWKQFPLYYMFIRGMFSDIFELDRLFGPKFILIDGNKLKTEPWIGLDKVTSVIGLERIFKPERFKQREDGFYCIKKDDSGVELDCMPSTKGVTGLGKKSMSRDSADLLTDFYKPLFDEFEEHFGAKLSWMP